MFGTLFTIFYLLCGAYSIYILYLGMQNSRNTTVIKDAEDAFSYLFVAFLVLLGGAFSLTWILGSAYVERTRRNNGGHLFRFGGNSK